MTLTDINRHAASAVHTSLLHSQYAHQYTAVIGGALNYYFQLLDIIKVSDTVHDGQTDRQTDRQTNRHYTTHWTWGLQSWQWQCYMTLQYHYTIMLCDSNVSRATWQNQTTYQKAQTFCRWQFGLLEQRCYHFLHNEFSCQTTLHTTNTS